jgi:disulfide bond formation protein DsbB
MTPLVQTVTDILSFGTLLCGFFAVFLFFILITPRREESGLAKRATDFFGKYSFLFAGIIAITATLSSLFYSNIAGFAPCILCWWQRIFLYPQAIIFAMAAFVKDKHIRTFCLIFSIIGGIISIYHSYLQFGGSPLIPCAAAGASVACTFRYFLEFGYITIPTMALTTFVILILLMLLKKKRD